MKVYISNTGYHNASNVGYPTLKTKPKAEIKTNFAFIYIFTGWHGFNVFSF